MTGHRFVLMDVFTDRPLAGNQLAVVFDADRLADERMQAIAREFNYSETTFVLSPRDSRATRRLRSFSPNSEVFGAGHNALGAWWAIVAKGDVAVSESATLWQELGDRVLPVDVTCEGGRPLRVAMTQGAPVIGSGVVERRALAHALSLDIDAFTVPGLEPHVISTGATHLLVPVRGLADLSMVRVDAARLISLAKPLGCEGCYLYCLETRDPRSVAHARGFFPGIGIAEDPATGSAAGPLGHDLVRNRRAPEKTWLTVEQGDEIGRPSRISVRISGDRVDVAGQCAIIAEGTLLP